MVLVLPRCFSTFASSLLCLIVLETPTRQNASHSSLDFRASNTPTSRQSQIKICSDPHPFSKWLYFRNKSPSQRHLIQHLALPFWMGGDTLHLMWWCHCFWVFLLITYMGGGGAGRNDIYFKSIIFLLVETRKVYSLGIYFPTTFLSFPYLIPHYSLSS